MAAPGAWSVEPGRPPRRAFFLAAALLTVLTALLLAGASVALRPPGLPAESDGVGEAVNRTVVIAFYDAVNAAIATGDLGPLTALVAPDLLTGEEAARAMSGTDELSRRLLALNATLPTLRLTIEAMAVDGDLAIVRVETSQVDRRPFLGLDLSEQPAPWGPVDVLRLAEGRVVAHEGGGPGGALLEPALAVELNLPPDAAGVVNVQRVTIEPRAAHVSGAAAIPRVLLLEAGALLVESAQTARQAASSATFAAGDHLVLPAGAGYTARNGGDEPAVVLDVFAYGAPYALSPPGLAAPAPAGSVVVQDLAGGAVVETPSGAAVLAIGWLTLAAGERLAWDDAAGPVLLHVEAGTVSLDPSVGVAWVRDGQSGRSITLGDDVVPSGVGVLVTAGNAVAIRADPTTPATVLVVTLLPVNLGPSIATPDG